MIWADRLGLVWAIPIGLLYLCAGDKGSGGIGLFVTFTPWVLARMLDFIIGGPFRRARRCQAPYPDTPNLVAYAEELQRRRAHLADQFEWTVKSNKATIINPKPIVGPSEAQ